MAVFSFVASCSLVEVYRRCRGAPSSGRRVSCTLLTRRPDDGGSKHLWNVGKLLPDYTAQQPRRQPSSYSPPWEPQISLSHVNVFCSSYLMSKFRMMSYNKFSVVLQERIIYGEKYNWYTLFNLYVLFGYILISQWGHRKQRNDHIYAYIDI
jgi:hypothetical protein